MPFWTFSSGPVGKTPASGSSSLVASASCEWPHRRGQVVFGGRVEGRGHGLLRALVNGILRPYRDRRD
jgi:hypothetical protein